MYTHILSTHTSNRDGPVKTNDMSHHQTQTRPDERVICDADTSEMREQNVCYSFYLNCTYQPHFFPLAFLLLIQTTMLKARPTHGARHVGKMKIKDHHPLNHVHTHVETLRWAKYRLILISGTTKGMVLKCFCHIIRKETTPTVKWFREHRAGTINAYTLCIWFNRIVPRTFIGERKDLQPLNFKAFNLHIRLENCVVGNKHERAIEL